MITAWPEEEEGGRVWVLVRTIADEADSVSIWNPFTLKEKVEAVKKLGGTFKEECPDVKLKDDGNENDGAEDERWEKCNRFYNIH